MQMQAWEPPVSEELWLREPKGVWAPEAARAGQGLPGAQAAQWMHAALLRAAPELPGAKEAWAPEAARAAPGLPDAV